MPSRLNGFGSTPSNPLPMKVCKSLVVDVPARGRGTHKGNKTGAKRGKKAHAPVMATMGSLFPCCRSSEHTALPSVRCMRMSIKMTSILGEVASAEGTCHARDTHCGQSTGIPTRDRHHGAQSHLVAILEHDEGAAQTAQHACAQPSVHRVVIHK